MNFEFFAVSHKGLVRENNEDYFCIPSNSPLPKGLVVLADGMGGHKSGEVASKMASDTFVTEFCALGDDKTITEKLLLSLEKANSAVYTAATDKLFKNNMGTTMTACYVEDTKAVFLNVGDSRAYLVRDNEAVQVTQDHSVVQELLIKSIITEEEAANHPQKNVITRAIGIEPTVNGDIFIKDIRHGDHIVLCSDGLTTHIDLNDLMILFDPACTVDSIANTLRDLALAQGGTDNVTVVVIRCD